MIKVVAIYMGVDPEKASDDRFDGVAKVLWER